MALKPRRLLRWRIVPRDDVGMFDERQATFPTQRRPWRNPRKRDGGLLVGAAIGVGRAATAAERGGADFLLALNAGRLRVRGATSLASMLPLADSNAYTLDFARAEILRRVVIPVFFGACAFDPQLDIGAFVRDLADEGFAGVANFPTVTHLGGRFRAALEAAGLGYSREVALLKAAKREGLAAFGYAKTRDEVDALIGAAADIVCVNFGWNAGGPAGFDEWVGLDEAAERARQLVRRIRRASPGTICVIEGGPIVTPEQMYQVCAQAGADGYVGGSTLDRLPFELAVMQSTSAFKTAAVVGQRALADKAGDARMPGFGGLVGQSAAFRELMATIGRVAANDLPVLIVGEAGSGKSMAARAIHAAGPRRRGPVIVVDGGADPAETELKLFGREASDGHKRRIAAIEAADTTVIVERFERLSAGLQLRIAAWLESGNFERGGGASVRGLARLIGMTSSDPLRLAAEGALREDLLARFLPARVDVPSLRDRLDDVPLIARHVLASLPGQAPTLDAEAYRALLRHAWPGNQRELRAVLERCALRARGSGISAAAIEEAIAGAAAPAPADPEDERGWIVEGLRRHRFRRGAAAAYLGLSRKTLYNKMRRYGIDG